MLALTSTANAQPIELRVMAGLQRLTATATADEEVSDGDGRRVDVAVGLAGIHARVGASTLTRREHLYYAELGNQSNTFVNEYVAARYLRAGADVERRVATSLVLTIGAGLLWAIHRNEFFSHSYVERDPSIRSSRQDVDDDLRHGVWLEAKLAWVARIAPAHAVGVELGVGYQRMRDEPPTSWITLTALVGTIGVAYRWN